MANIQKEQLKKIIKKELADILKEVKDNEVKFNQIAYEKVINSLIEKGLLSEQLGSENFMSSLNPWSSANKMRRGVSAAEEEEELQPGESWDDARARLGYAGTPPIGDEGFMPTGEEAPPEEEATELAPVDFGPGGETGGLPAHFQQELIRITQSAPAEFRNNINDVGNEVYNTLQSEVGGLKSQEQLGELVLQIVGTVVAAMGSAGGRKWASGDAFEKVAPEPYFGGTNPNEPNFLDQLLAQGR